MSEITERGGFLAFADFGEDFRLAVQFNFVLIDDEELGAEMADARANLPRGEWILIGRIVADEENGLRVIKLIHRQQGIGGAFATKGAQRGDQAGVVGGAMVIDIVGAEGGAGQALEEVIFFVGSAVGANEADGVRAIFGVNFF